MKGLEILRGIDLAKCDVVAEGKSKIIYKLDDTTGFMVFKPYLRSVTYSRVGIIPETDMYRLYLTMVVLKKLEENYIPTHLAYDKIVNINGKLGILVKLAKAIPIEWISRYYAAGSIVRLFPGYVVEGQKFTNPLHKYDIKIDVSKTGGIDDPTMNESYIIGLGLLNKNQFDEADDLLICVSKCVNNLLKEADIKLIDMKIEFGFYNGDIIVIDEISQDCVRANDMCTGKALSKDAFRQMKSDEDVLAAYKKFLEIIYPDYESLLEKNI